MKLLRFLQEQVIDRVGGRKEISVDARVIAATNKDLHEAMERGKFREDLYFRIGIITISLPPLRERKNDIMLLARGSLDRFAGENNKNIKGFTESAVKAIREYAWPGNVRELENRVKRAVIMAEGDRITPDDLEMGLREFKYRGVSLKEARERLEKEIIQKVLSRNEGNISKAASDLSISRPALYALMEKLGIPNE